MAEVSISLPDALVAYLNQKVENQSELVQSLLEQWQQQQESEGQQNHLESSKIKPEHKSQPLSSFLGILRDSPSFKGDPVEIQRALRREWD